MKCRHVWHWYVENVETEFRQWTLEAYWGFLLRPYAAMPFEPFNLYTRRCYNCRKDQVQA